MEIKDKGLQELMDIKNRLVNLIDRISTESNNDLTKICFNYACEDLDKSKDKCKRDKVCDMQIRKIMFNKFFDVRKWK